MIGVAIVVDRGMGVYLFTGKITVIRRIIAVMMVMTTMFVRILLHVACVLEILTLYVLPRV